VIHKPKKIRGIVAGLFGAIFADSGLDTEAQNSKVQKVNTLRTQALNAADIANADFAFFELQAMNRAAEIPSLNRAAASLAGITVLVTGLFTGIGFTTGDFTRMVRDIQWAGIAFLILASVALLLGTFAVVINPYRAQKNLWAERVAVYFGIACAAAAFILASWGLAQGASAGPTRPTISASFDMTSNIPVLKVSVSSSDVPDLLHLMVTVWGQRADRWVDLSNLVTGPTHDGADNADITVSNVAPYTTIVVNALLSSIDVTAKPPQPDQCSTGMSCFTIVGLGTSSPTPRPTP